MNVDTHRRPNRENRREPNEGEMALTIPHHDDVAEHRYGRDPWFTKAVDAAAKQKNTTSEKILQKEHGKVLHVDIDLIDE